ncbi:hypothetical protein Aduo_000015 [Ancylostoma duodenale]
MCEVFLAISIGLVHGLIFLPLMLSLFVRGFCTVGSRKVDEPAMTIAIISPSAVPAVQRHPPPDTPPPKPPTHPAIMQPCFLQENSHFGTLRSSLPWLDPRFADGFETSPNSTILDAPPLIPTRVPNVKKEQRRESPPFPPKIFRC